MTSRDEINPSGLPTDSLDNAFEDSLSLNLNSDTPFSASAAGPSGIRSRNSDPIIKNPEDQDLEDENFKKPQENLTAGNLNFDIFTDNDCSQESYSQRFISFEHRSNSLHLDESVNDDETSLNENLISKYETFNNAFLQETGFNKTETYPLEEALQNNSKSPSDEDSLWASFSASVGYGSRDNVSGREKSNIKMTGVLEEMNETEANQLKEMSQVSSKSTSYEDSFSASSSSGSDDSISDREKSNTRMTGVLEEIGTLANETEAYQLKEMPQISARSTSYEDSLWASFSAPVGYGSGDNVSEREKSNLRMTGVLEEIGTSMDKTQANELKEMPQITFKSTFYEDSFWAGFSASASSGSGDNISYREKSNTRMTGVLEEIGTLADETEAYQLKEMPQITSRSTDHEDSFSADSSPSTSSGSKDDVTERQKSDIKVTDVLKEIDSFNSKNLKTECTGNGEDSVSFEQRKFETPEDCSFFHHPFSYENKNLNKQLASENDSTLAGAILPQNITRNYVSDRRDYLLNASNTVHENDSNLKIWSEFTSNETTSDNIKEIGVDGNYLEIEELHGGNSTSNNNADNQLSYLSVDELYKYQELKGITRNFFKLRKRSSLHKNQRKETVLEAEESIKTSNIPSLSTDPSSIDKGVVNSNYNGNPQNNGELKEDCKFEHRILNMNENVTTEFSFTSVQNIFNSNLTNKSDSRKDESTTVISKTESDNFAPSSETPPEISLEKEEHITALSQRNRTMHSVNNISLSEKNGNYEQIFNAECQNINSESTSCLNSEQFTNMACVYQQNVDHFENIDAKFAAQKLISDRKQIIEMKDVDENICILESKQSSKVKCSTVTNANSAIQPFINESRTTANYISCNKKTPTSSEKIIGTIRNSDLLDSKSSWQKDKTARNIDMHDISRHDSELLHRQTNTPDVKNDKGNISFESLLIPPSVSDSTKTYIAENRQFDETSHHFESCSQLQKNKSTSVSDSYENMRSRRLEDIEYKFSLPFIEEPNQDQEINLRHSQRLLNLPNRQSDTGSEVTTAKHKELNKVVTEKQTSKKTSIEDAPRDSKKLKTCKEQSKSLRTTCQTITKGDFISTENSRTFISSDMRSTKDESIPSTFLRMAEVLQKYNKRQEPSTSKNNEFVFGPRKFNDKRTDGNTSLSFRNNCEGTSANQENISSSFRRIAEVMRKYDNKCQIPSTSKINEFEPRKFNDEAADGNASLLFRNSCEGTSANQKTIPSPFSRIAEVLRKYDNKCQEPSTSKNIQFEPRIVTDQRTDGNSSLPLSNSSEGTPAAQTVFDFTVTAVKQLNDGNGTTVLDIVSYVRANLPSSEKKLYQDVRKALKDATEAGFLTFANGKYKEIPKSIEVNTSKEPTKRKTTRVNDNSHTKSKRVKPTPTVPTRTVRPKTRQIPKNESKI